MNSPQPNNVISLKPQPFAPPTAPDVEIAVLGGILFDPSAIVRVAPILKPETFYSSVHQEIYKACLALHRQDLPVDILSVATFFQERGLLDKIGGQSMLVRLVDPIVSTANIDYYAEVLVRKWRRREILRVSREIAALAHDETLEDDYVQNEIESRLTGLFLEGHQQSLRPIVDFVYDELDRIGEHMANPTATGISTGFYDLDALMLGLRPAKLGIIAGRPGMGKSALLGSIAHNIAQQGKSVAIFSLEMSGGEIAQRLMASVASVNSARFKTGVLDEKSWDSVCLTVEQFAESKIWIDDSVDISVAHIRSKVRELQIKQGVDVIMIDYLHLMLDGSDEDIREIGKITRALKNLSRELNINIQLLSQLSRAVENRSDKRPIMSDLRASGNIEQDADTIVFIYRDEYYNPESSDRGVAELILAKNRDGATGAVKLLFEPQYSRFRNIASRG